IVTVVEALVPTAVLIRLTVAGLNSTPVAIPDNATVCGLVASLSKTLSVPAGKPTEVGAKFTRMSQVPPTMIFVFALQVVMPGLMVKGPITEVAGFFSVSVALVLLVKVILVGPLIDPTAVAANAIELGFKLTELVPVPDWLKGQMAIRSLNAPEHGGQRQHFRVLHRLRDYPLGRQEVNGRFPDLKTVDDPEREVRVGQQTSLQA